MKATIIHCEKCGAQLEPAEGATSVACPYCKTVSQIAGRASGPQAVFTGAAPQVVVTVGRPIPIPTKKLSMGIRLVLLLAVLGPVVGIVVGIGGAAIGVATSLGVGLPSFGGVDQWEGVHGALLTDVSGDGVPDLLGRARYVGSSDRVTLAAFDGTSGALLWESEALGTYTETYQGSLGLAEDLLLFADEGGQLRTFSARDGEPSWHASLADKATRFCQEAPGQVRVDLANGSATRLLLADGHLAPPPPEGAACARLADDGAEGDPSYTLSTDSISGEPVGGMRARTTLRRDGGPTVYLGTRSAGSSVPMIGVVFDDPAQSWKSDLAATRPLETGPWAPEVGAVTADRVYTVYGFTDTSRPRMLVAFDLAGQRRWETPLPNTMPLTSVQATDDRIFVSQWGHLQAFDAATGEATFSIGR
jgi:outer membrane protein assembly factor BamB